ncbi:signal peptidase I [Sinosporangium siamense]|uniref:Signal peptidase I n=1 Tax=Sinosporangium siamense TaxID=1367973 RepID=A0A919VAT4_9ACTN|nr:signal peptidase I [Sinosporangium siamense]GII91429.1 signal peptidase I [Sinosporangium siamense]
MTATENIGPDEPASPQRGAGSAETPESAEKADSDAQESAEPPKKKRGKRGAVVELLALVVVGVVTAMLLQAFVVKPFWIPSESMENTLLVSDRVLVNRLDGTTERGDIVVFKGWDGLDTIKRVIGVGGDTIKCCDDKQRITVNGHPLEEKSYIHPDDFPSDPFEVKVPQGRLWLMGDHRSRSVDSRSHQEAKGDGTISEDDVIGHAFAIYWPLSRAKFLSTPDSFSKLP